MNEEVQRAQNQENAMNHFDWTIILTGIGIVIAVVACNIGLMAWLRADMKSFETEIRGWRSEINKQMTDFHGKLCRFDERSKEKK